ncbi:hypothetical protein Pcinc_003899 [Petrolisthes cinctipes]|uniref:Gag-like protein n=1 Tax=Petrolisthes cinctipes TaxID=88211 RepID=A0AAE1GMN3_PETCI|nr:hypothetical protein Pcinc_003899 [Petrolisthes cinctipes]
MESSQFHPSTEEAEKMGLPTFIISRNENFQISFHVLDAIEQEYPDLGITCKPVGDADYQVTPKDAETAKFLAELHTVKGKSFKKIVVEPGTKETRWVVTKYPISMGVERLLKHDQITSAKRCEITFNDEGSNKRTTSTRQVVISVKGQVENNEIFLGIFGDFKLRPFIPEPKRCFRCQKLQHTHENCHLPFVCAICVGRHKTDICIQKHKNNEETIARCVNCDGPHHAWSYRCRARKVIINSYRNRNEKECDNPTNGQTIQDTPLPSRRAWIQPLLLQTR